MGSVKAKEAPDVDKPLPPKCEDIQTNGQSCDAEEFHLRLCTTHYYEYWKWKRERAERLQLRAGRLAAVIMRNYRRQGFKIGKKLYAECKYVAVKLTKRQVAEEDMVKAFIQQRRATVGRSLVDPADAKTGAKQLLVEAHKLAIGGDKSEAATARVAALTDLAREIRIASRPEPAAKGEGR